MRYLVIEYFRNGDARPAYKRFAESGRMLVPGLNYIESWISEDLTTCYQFMETDDYALLEAWMEKWADLVEFNVVPVITSAEAAERVKS